MGNATRSLAALLCFSAAVWVHAQKTAAQDRPRPALTVPASVAPATMVPEIMPLDQIHEGMKGFALNVFQGVKPESMDVEVLGVMHQTRIYRSGGRHEWKPGLF
jgi:hypothetical protein